MKSMKIHYRLLLILASVVITFSLLIIGGAGQDKDPKSKASPTPIVDTPKSLDTIILSKEKILTIESLAKSIRIAELEIQNAIPTKLKDAMEQATKARDDYWKTEIGISPMDVQSYEVSQGQNGDVILKKKPPVVSNKEVKK